MHEGEWGLLPPPDTSCPPVPVKSKIRQHLLVGHAVQLPTAKAQGRPERCLAIEGSGRAGFSSLGDSQIAIFISKPTLKLAFVTGKENEI